MRAGMVVKEVAAECMCVCLLVCVRANLCVRVRAYVCVCVGLKLYFHLLLSWLRLPYAYRLARLTVL